MNVIAKSLLGGLALTGLTMLVPYTYCQNGPGRGLPFAVYSPSCGATFAALGRKGKDDINQVVDLAKLVGDIALWGGVAFGVQSRLSRRKRF